MLGVESALAVTALCMTASTTGLGNEAGVDDVARDALAFLLLPVDVAGFVDAAASLVEVRFLGVWTFVEVVDELELAVGAAAATGGGPSMVEV